MIMCMPNFPINTIIEFFVTLTKSLKEILSLLQRSSSSVATNLNLIQRSTLILYFGRLLKRATIMECPYGFGLIFRSDVFVVMSIHHNFTFNDLLKKITQGFGCGDHKKVTEISYHCVQ